MHEDLEMPKLGPTKQDDPKWTPTPWVVNSYQQTIEGCDYIIVAIPKNARSMVQPVDYHNLRRIRDCVNGLAYDGAVAELMEAYHEARDYFDVGCVGFAEDDPRCPCGFCGTCKFKEALTKVRALVGERPA